MRILMLSQFYPPIIGGVERHVRNLSIELAARGHDVAVATLWQEDLPSFECDQGVRVYRIRGSLQRVPRLFIEKGRQYSPPFPDPEVLWALRHITIQERPNIVHAHNWMVHSFTLLKALSKAKLIVTFHDFRHNCVNMGLMHHGKICDGPGFMKCLECATGHYGALKGVPLTLANWTGGKIERQTVDMFLAVSQAVAEGTQLTKYRVPHRIIPNFVPNDVGKLRDDANPLLAQLPQDNFLLFVGNIGRNKGVGVLLQAYSEMDSQVPLVLIGRVMSDFPMNFSPNIQVLQNWPHEAVMSAWGRCSIALVPSIWPDPCPTVAIEAMAMGKPVIASRIGGLSDIIIDGETGFLVPASNPQALRKAIQYLLEDPAQRVRMGVRAEQRAEEFQARAVVPRIEQVYQDVLHS